MWLKGVNIVTHNFFRIHTRQQATEKGKEKLLRGGNWLARRLAKASRQFTISQWEPLKEQDY